VNPPSHPFTAPHGTSEAYTQVERHLLGEYVRYGIYRHEPTQRYTYNIRLKVVGGIREAVGWWPEQSRPSASQLVTECCRNGLLSPRPYRLGQPQDSTTTTCVWALYANYCDNAHYHRTDLLRRGYPYSGMERQWTPQIWSNLIEHAEWEGVNFPIRWDAGSAIQLVQALIDLNETCLAELLAATFATTPLNANTTPPRFGASGCPESADTNIGT
jgi:hypothetical protein